MNTEQIDNIIEYLDELKEDSTMSKNVKGKVDEIIEILKSDKEFSIKIDIVMHKLEEIHEDSNIDSYTRTQLWSIVPMLESM